MLAFARLRRVTPNQHDTIRERLLHADAGGHLAGTLYPMRMGDFTRFGCTAVLFSRLLAAGDG